MGNAPWICQPTWDGGGPDNCPTWPKPNYMDFRQSGTVESGMVQK
jgi:hypothetical protein